jgi:hypothetical protein
MQVERNFLSAVEAMANGVSAKYGGLEMKLEDIAEDQYGIVGASHMSDNRQMSVARSN